MPVRVVFYFPTFLLERFVGCFHEKRGRALNPEFFRKILMIIPVFSLTLPVSFFANVELVFPCDDLRLGARAKRCDRAGTGREVTLVRFLRFYRMCPRRTDSRWPAAYGLCSSEFLERRIGSCAWFYSFLLGDRSSLSRFRLFSVLGFGWNAEQIFRPGRPLAFSFTCVPFLWDASLFATAILFW